MAHPAGTYWKLHKTALMLIALGGLCFGYMGYSLERTDLFQFLLVYGLCFFVVFKLIQFEKWNFKLLLASGIVFRLVLLAATPNLSEDFYRFIWDGALILEGVNPYEFTPEELAAGGYQALGDSGIYNGISTLSKGLHSNYPPLNQLFFALGVMLGGKRFPEPYWPSGGFISWPTLEWYTLAVNC